MNKTDIECSKCGKELDNSTAYEYRGALSCFDCFKGVIEQRDLERNEIINESKHKTDRFKGLDLSDSVIGKANREILKPDIQIAKKESMRRKRYEGKMTIQPNRDDYIVNCDFCSNYLEVEGDFKDALKEMKFYGWKTFKKDDEWVNQCPACGEEK